MKGVVHLKIGDIVKPDKVVASTKIPGNVQLLQRGERSRTDGRKRRNKKRARSHNHGPGKNQKQDLG